MHIITKNTEKALHEFAKSVVGNATGWRCIHFDFANAKEQYSDGIRSHIVVNVIRDMLKSEEGTVYLCKDGDIFIMFRGSVQRLINKLGEHIQIFIPNLEQALSANTVRKNENELCSVMDLQRHWEHFSWLCHSKNVTHKEEDFTYQDNKEATLPKPFVLDKALFKRSASTRPKRDKLSVLLVEDDMFTRRLISNALNEKYTIIQSEFGSDALDKYQHNAPDIVFLDIELPDMNGHVILQEIVSFDPDAFVVILSGNSFKENIIAALEDGAQGFVTKPFTKDKLLHYIESCETTKLSRMQHHPTATQHVHQ